MHFGRVSQSMVGILWCLAFLAGLGLARFETGASVWVAVVLLIWAIVLRKKYRLAYVVLACLAMLIFGMWRGEGFVSRMKPYGLLADKKVVFTAKVDSDAVYAQKKQLSFTVRNVQFESPMRTSPPGAIRVNGFGELAIYKGDIVRVEGKLRQTRGSSQGSIYFAQFRRVGSSTNLINDFVRRFTAGVQTAVPEPAASFGMGLLIGQRTTLPQQHLDALKMVGLMHIVAVSGYNLTIILNFARRFFEKRSKRVTMFVAVTLMLAFLACTGMSASIVRASVVSGLGLVAWYVGRKVRPTLLILLSASLTAGVYPVYLWSDIGWWLSFLAFYGILVVAPLIVDRFWKTRQPHALMAVALETLCAELMTIPLVLFIFGQVSSVGLVANVLVVMLIPLAMLLTFMAGLAGWLVPVLAGWLGLPAQLLLTYMLDIAQLLSKLPHAFTSGVYIHLVDMLVLYTMILGMVFVMTRRKAWHLLWHNFYASEREKGIL